MLTKQIINVTKIFTFNGYNLQKKNIRVKFGIVAAEILLMNKLVK